MKKVFFAALAVFGLSVCTLAQTVKTTTTVVTQPVQTGMISKVIVPQTGSQSVTTTTVEQQKVVVKRKHHHKKCKGKHCKYKHKHNHGHAYGKKHGK